MKIAYVTPYDSLNIESWSGSSYHILMALRDSGFHTEAIRNLRDSYRHLTRAKKLIYSKILARTYLRDRHAPTLRSYAEQIETALAPLHCDVVFSPGTVPLAFLRTGKPMVFWTDATFAGMIDFYPAFSNLCEETLRNGNALEQQAISRCRLAIYSSQWAADSAIRHYDVDPAKIRVVPFGANIECRRGMDDIRGIIAEKNMDVCRLLFVGVDWHRKGGDVALEVARRLNRDGLPTELHVVGCQPPSPLPDFVKLHGYVSKCTEAGRKTLDRLFSEAHFLIVPSRAECAAVVFAEASSFGLPSLGTEVGGIPTVVRNDRNGRTFPLTADPDSYCQYIVQVLSRKEDYESLAISTFREYSERLNWSAAGRKVRELIHEFCA